MPIFHEHIISNEKNNHKMKKYTTPEQTAKLIELGVEQPKSIEVYRDGHCVPFVEQRWVYSIGELIEMLGVHLSSIYYIGIEWFVNAEGIERRRDELIDALYDMILKLKEKRVI
jgi:hypothetical protein